MGYHMPSYSLTPQKIQEVIIDSGCHSRCVRIASDIDGRDHADRPRVRLPLGITIPADGVPGYMQCFHHSLRRALDLGVAIHVSTHPCQASNVILLLDNNGTVP